MNRMIHSRYRLVHLFVLTVLLLVLLLLPNVARASASDATGGLGTACCATGM
jgi:hypothetical protein